MSGCGHGKTFKEPCTECQLVLAREGLAWALQNVEKYSKLIAELALDGSGPRVEYGTGWIKVHNLPTMHTTNEPQRSVASEHPIGQGMLRTQEIMCAADMEAKIAALAHRFWSIHPSTLDDMGLTREEFYASEMVKLFRALTRNEPQEASDTRRPQLAKDGWWTWDEEAAREGAGNLYYFAPAGAAMPPYAERRFVSAIIDIADDGTLAGVELIGDMPPPPSSSMTQSDRGGGGNG